MMSRFPTLDTLIWKRTAVVAVLASVGAVAWAGCGSGDSSRYYCDSAGCYSCDAYGCSTVAPPTHPACTGAASCGSGSVCTTTGCAQTCSDAVPCPQGEVCKSGVCAAPATDPGTTKTCTTKADCGDGKACIADTCQACGGSAGPCPCTTATVATDCTSTETCVAGSCTDPTNTCKFSSECDSGKICAGGQCLVSCDTAPCATGFTCTKGACEPNAPAGPDVCTSDQQCSGDTPTCVAGSCVKACTSDATCGAGKYCDQGACVLDTRPHPNCTDDTQCGSTAATPKKCVGGFCKYTCTTDQGDAYCRTIDNRIGYCAKDNVCRTASEANAQCVLPTDCTGGQVCVDNQCK